MNEPRFARMWRRRAFGLRRNGARKALEAAESPRNGLELLAEAIRSAAAKLKLLRPGGRRARIRLVHPQQTRPPAPVEPAAMQTVRLDARGLQKLLETELVSRSPRRAAEEVSGEQERVRRSG